MVSIWHDKDFGVTNGSVGYNTVFRNFDAFQLSVGAVHTCISQAACCECRGVIRSKVLLAFGAAALVVVSLCVVTWLLAREASEADRWVARTHEVIGHLARVRSETLEIEYITQSYRISGHAARLLERDATMSAREVELQQLIHLTSATPAQQERLGRLRGVLDERIALARQIEFLRKTQGAEVANQFVTNAPLAETRERTYRILQEMDADERRMLEMRIAAQEQTRQIVVGVEILASLSLFALMAGTYVLIRRQLREAEAGRRALADSEESLATTLHSIGDGVLATDTQGRVTRMNRVAEELTGWTAVEARGRCVEDVFHIVHGISRALAEMPVAKVFATGEPQLLSDFTVLIARDGREYPIADSAAPIRDSAGRVRGVVLVFRDVTLERAAQRTIFEQTLLLEERVLERTQQLRDSEAHLCSVLGNAPAMIAFVDASQRYVYVNRQYQECFAPERQNIAGCTVREVLGTSRYAIAQPLIEQVLQGNVQAYDWQPFPDVWQAIHYAPRYDATHVVTGYYVLGTDITPRKRAEREILELNLELGRRLRELQHVSRALRTLSAGNRTMLRSTNENELLANMCDAIVAAGGYGMGVVWYRVHDAAQSLLPMAETGYPVGLEGLRQLNASWADNAYGAGAAAAAIRTGRTQVVSDMQTDPKYAPWRPHLYGNSSVVACPLWVAGEVIGALAVYDRETDTLDQDEVALLTESAADLAFGIATLRDRAERQKASDALFRLTHFDALTGLPNETQFSAVLNAKIADSADSHRGFVLMQVDVERLSDVNDALGFGQGDQMLREFGTRLSSAVPKSATVARLRGDEFAILLPEADADAALATVRTVQAALAGPCVLADIAIDISAKIGVVVFPEHGKTPRELFRHLDIAVRQAKKNRVGHVFFDPLQWPSRSPRLTMAGELRRAIEGGDLRLYLQPKVDMVSGQVCGAEGLVRWEHAERGLISPHEFIGLAEHTGLIKPLTAWVIETALRLNHGWASEGHATPIAVNLSAHNLRDEGFLDMVRQLRREWPVADGLLEMEITESTLMEDAEFSLRVLHSLHDEGIALYIDDFGTGYSSLSYLQKLPVDYIKIDQSFVRALSTSTDSALIVRSTIDLAHDLGGKVVAEGIETQADWEQLAAFGCDVAQGFFLAKPMPAEEFPGWLARFCPPSA